MSFAANLKRLVPQIAAQRESCPQSRDQLCISFPIAALSSQSHLPSQVLLPATCVFLVGEEEDGVVPVRPHFLAILTIRIYISEHLKNFHLEVVGVQSKAGNQLDPYASWVLD